MTAAAEKYAVVARNLSKRYGKEAGLVRDR
jgi:hypothetical protein